MDEISKRRLHIVLRIFDQLCSVLLRRAYTLLAQLLAGTRLQDLLAVLSHRARLRRSEEKQSEFHDSGVQSRRHHMAFLRASRVPSFPERQLRSHQANNRLRYEVEVERHMGFHFFLIAVSSRYQSCIKPFFFF